MQNPDSDTEGGAIFAGKLWLNTLENTRKTFARVIRAYARGNMTERNYRSLVYGLSQYVNVWKVQIDYEEFRELEERIRELETS